MKTERRHELKESDLTHALESGRRYLETHGKTVGVGVVVVVLIVLGTTFAQSARRSAAEDRWKEKRSLAYDTPENTKKSLATLAVLARESDDVHFALAALMDQGTQALRLATSDGGKPDPELNDIAHSAFESLLDRFPQNSMANGVAHLGLATVAENRFVLDEGITHKGEALKHLEAVLSDSAMHTLPFYQIALDRKAAVDDTFTVVVFAPPLTPVGDSAGGNGPTTVIEQMPGVRRVDPPVWAKDLPPLQKTAPDQTQTKTQDDEPQDTDKDQGLNDATTDTAPPTPQPAKEDAPVKSESTSESQAKPEAESKTESEAIPETQPESGSPPNQEDR